MYRRGSVALQGKEAFSRILKYLNLDFKFKSIIEIFLLISISNAWKNNTFLKLENSISVLETKSTPRSLPIPSAGLDIIVSRTEKNDFPNFKNMTL